jgi:hypothetical protein
MMCCSYLSLKGDRLDAIERQLILNEEAAVTSLMICTKMLAIVFDN